MDAKPLTNKQLEQYEKLLMKEKKEVQKLIDSINDIQKKGSKENSGDLSSYALHQADHGSDTAESEFRVSMLNQEFKTLKKINVALGKIYDKSYGICEICGERISSKRLKAMPYARFCIECKTQEENKQKTNNRRR
jgi:RNA polymerase-binding protein DksA